MTKGDEGNSLENSTGTREEMIYAASQMPYLVSVCVSAEDQYFANYPSIFLAFNIDSSSKR
jgi:hypothetical protein